MASDPSSTSAKRPSWLLGTKTSSDFLPQAPPFNEGMDYLLAALAQADYAWPTFEVRMLLRGNAEDRPESIFYLHIEGCFSSTVEPLDTQLAEPEVLAGRLDASTTYEYLRSWGRGEEVAIGDRRLHLPLEQLGALIPDHSRLHDQTYLHLLGRNYPSLSGAGINGWIITAASVSAWNEDGSLSNQFRLAGYQAGSDVSQFSLHHLGRDYTRFNSPVVTVVLPLPAIFTTWAEQGEVHAELHLRPPLALEQFWVATSTAPWDLKHERHRDWHSETTEHEGWVKGALVITERFDASTITVWSGRGESPETTARIEVPVPTAAGNSDVATSVSPPANVDATPAPLRVFIVHGHDHAIRHEVIRFLEAAAANFEVRVLSEAVNKGRTLIEKFEQEAGAATFAVVLLTADDVGGSKDSGTAEPRGRQNVVLEMGFFFGSLGRDKVAILYQEGIELPSDVNGIAYILLDPHEGWMVRLARELRAAGHNTDLNKIT